MARITRKYMKWLGKPGEKVDNAIFKAAIKLPKSFKDMAEKKVFLDYITKND